jgi:hypothetical protein
MERRGAEHREGERKEWGEPSAVDDGHTEIF